MMVVAGANALNIKDDITTNTWILDNCHALMKKQDKSTIIIDLHIF